MCASGEVAPFLSIPQVPVHCNLLWEDRAAAQNAPRGDIRLAFCSGCGHVFNLAFDPARMAYSQAYENSLHFSPRFQTYAANLARSLVERHDLRGKELVEIGAGQGDFLRLLVELGDNRGTGFDAAYVPENGRGDPRLRFVQGFDWWQHVEQAPDMIYARHVLEHIATPLNFVAGIRANIGPRPDTLVFLEVPNMAYTLRARAVWDIIYEHCGYFSSHSLERLLRAAGFRVLRTAEVYAGQFLTVEALPASGAAAPDAAAAELRAMQARIAAFAADFARIVADWQAKLAAWERQGRRVVAWGSGSKGTMFLNVLQPRAITTIVDINPRKHGRYVVGTGQRIVSPDFLRDDRPDIVILMNPIYRDEVAGMLAELGVTAVIELA